MFKVDSKTLESKKRNAKLITIALNIAFYFVVMAWFCLSLITGKFIWRMTINVVFFFITTVYVVSLCRIRKTIERFNTRKDLKPNDHLINLNLATFTLELVVYVIMFTMTNILDHYTAEVDTDSDTGRSLYNRN